MKKYKFLTLVIAIITAQSAFSENIKLIPGKETKFTILKSDYSGLRISNSLVELNSISVKTKAGIFVQLGVPAYGSSMINGEPQIPVLKKLIEVPEGAGFRIKILNAEYQEFNLADFNITDKVFPSQPTVSKSIDNPENLEFIMNQAVYLTDGYSGSELITINYLGKMRGVNLARLEIAPIRYNPVQNKIEVCTSLEAEIIFTDGDVQKTIDEKKALFSPYLQSNYALIANYKQEITDELILDEPVTYIIISDPMFETTLQPFIQWKIKKGFNVVQAYTNDPLVGTTTTSIKTYLQNFYTNPPAGYNAQSFVLFVGDVAQIPAFSGTAGSHVTDLYYCTYDGSGDIYPDCYYGRFSAESVAELQPQIDKTLEYEQYLMPDPSFLDEAVMVAGADATYGQLHGNGQINYGTTYYFNSAHGLLSHTYLQPEPGGANYATNIHQNVSDGVAYANYTAHCSSNGWADPSFSIGDIAGLSNAHKYCLMVGNCCLSTEFDVNDCFAEKMLNTANKGAVGYVGGSNSTYWDEDFWWGVGFETVTVNPVYHAANLGAYDRTFHDQGEPLAQWYVTQGQMPSAGDLAVTQAGSSMITYYWEIYHLMGDPSLMIYFSQPPVTTATYTGLMPLGSTSFTINTNPYAYVAISKDGVLYGTAVADGSGVAEINLIPITVPGTADIVITRQNGQPFISTVVVASPEGPYVLLDSFVIDDNGGNNNGLAEYGEEVALNVTLKNLGNSTATNINASLSTSDIYVSVTNAVHSWPAITSGSTSLQNNAFTIQVSGNIPDQHSATFDLEITDGTDTWNSSFNIILNAPFLEPTISLAIDDAVGGNGNGRLDPGETATITAVVENNGHSLSPAASASLSSASPYITVNSGSASLGQIAAGNSANAVFNISCDASTPIGQSVDLAMNVDAGNYGFAHTYYQSVGLVLEDWETGDFTRFPWTFSGNGNWTIASTGQYEGFYTSKSGTITHSQVSDLSVMLLVNTAAYISFFYKVSSESSYDYLHFYIDGVQQNQWSGEVAWTQASFAVTAGQHTFKWSYSKDGSVSSGSDCAWVDYIVFPPSTILAPEISVDPLVFNVTVAPDEVSSLPLLISNSGNMNLTWNASTNIDAKYKGTAAYCTASGGCDEYISNVVFNTINNASSCSQYSDYTSISTTVTAGETYNITVTNGTVYSTDDLGVWIDWNQNQDFTDAGENVVCAYSNSGQGTYAITVPQDAFSGSARMRIRIKYSGDDCGSSCGTTTYGEVEDYTVIVEGVNQWLSISPASGTISQGNNQNPVVGFDATGLSEGVYTGQITLSSNDADEGTIVIPCTMNVSSGFTVSLNAFLDGPFNGSGMMAMQGSCIPLIQPFQYGSMELQRIRKPFFNSCQYGRLDFS